MVLGRWQWLITILSGTDDWKEILSQFSVLIQEPVQIIL
jgi:hypothetical protein